ncbi:transmembrane protein [Toxoplasma gondii TgCatPRC2]|uniref:Transmembrane protein n=1 Tax=Toxoplasma gondii TgCatPRC2 TaxID=1130821 RepID=A0A151H7Z6_TOXGO|nr:transmembrane protein [Toxoplasma gondii TgCatPRC2]
MPPAHHGSGGRRRPGRGNKGKRDTEAGMTASPDPGYMRPETPAAPSQQTDVRSPASAREHRNADVGVAAPDALTPNAGEQKEVEGVAKVNVAVSSDQPPDWAPSQSDLPPSLSPTTASRPATSSRSPRARSRHSPVASSSAFSSPAPSASAFTSASGVPEAPLAAPELKHTLAADEGNPEPRLEGPVERLHARQENPLTDSSDGSYILLEEGESQRACLDRKNRHLRQTTPPGVWTAADLASQNSHSASFASGFRRALLPSGGSGDHDEQASDCRASLRGMQRPCFGPPSTDTRTGAAEGLPLASRRRRQHWRRELRAFGAVALACLRASWHGMKRARLRATRWIDRNAATVRVACYTFLLLVTSTGNTICFKKMIDKMPNYSPCLTQVTTVVFVPVFFALSLYTDYAGGLPQEMADFPKRNFAVMGFLDSFSGVMAIIGAVHTTGTTQVVLQQSCIVFSLLASIVMLRKRFHAAHYLGALVIILGVLVVKLPDLLHPSSDGGGDVFVFNLLYLLSNLPTAVSCVYKEVAFRGVEMGTNYLQAWVALFQFLIGFLVLPLNALPVLGPQRVPLAELPASLWNGTRCLFGFNTIVTNCGGAGNMESPCDNCEGAWKYVGMYLSFNLLYNMFIIFVVKSGGAALTFLVSTLRLPVTALAFCSRAIMGDRAVPPKATDFYGLLVLILGLVIYRAGGIMKRRAQRRAVAAARGHTSSPMMLTPREEEQIGTIFVEEVFAAGELEDGGVTEEDETDDDTSEVEVHPVFSSVVASEPPHVYVHTKRHSHSDGGYHKLPACGSSPAAFTPFTQRMPGTGSESCSRRRNRDGDDERSPRSHACSFDEETGFAGGTGTDTRDLLGFGDQRTPLPEVEMQEVHSCAGNTHFL